MKVINTKQVLKDFLGEDIKSGGEKVVVGTIIANVLGGRTSNPTLAWVLGKKFATDKTVDLKAEDIVFLKENIEAAAKLTPEQGGWLTSLLAGQIIEILESKTK